MKIISRLSADVAEPTGASLWGNNPSSLRAETSSRTGRPDGPSPDEDGSVEPVVPSMVLQGRPGGEISVLLKSPRSQLLDSNCFS